MSLSVMALEPSERLENVRILKTLPDNIILLDRGIEDGILRNDHIKLTNEVVGYASRAICIRPSATTSYWKIYRVPNADAFSKDYTYTIVGYSDRKIPMPIAKIRNSKQDISEPVKRDPGPDPFNIQMDLPERLTERDLIHATGPDQRKIFSQQVFDQEQLKRDLSEYQLSVYASPFTRQTTNNGESLRYGFRGGNVASKYRLLTQFEQQQTKLRDPLTEESVSTRSTSGQAQFIIQELKPGVSSLSILNYQSTRFSSLVATPKSHWQMGPVGLTWHFYESKSWEYMDLSYVPLFDIRETEIIEPTRSISTVKTNGLRHGVRFAVKSKINERVAFENLLWVRPFQDLSTWEVDGGDLNLVNDLKFVFNLTGKLFFDYNFVYQRDKLWSTLNNLPETNTINSLNIRYDFDL